MTSRPLSPGITSEQVDALTALAPSLDAAVYLAGGVAIALELHHRTSLDLDLFTGHDFDPDRLAERLVPVTPSMRVVGRARGTLHAEVCGVPVSILSYRYPLLGPARHPTDVPVPVAAGRGAAKDFWDLHELLGRGIAGGDLQALMALYQQKFVREDIGHAVRSLAYFGDADGAPLPNGLSPTHWTAIKTDVARWVKAL